MVRMVRDATVRIDDSGSDLASLASIVRIL